MIENDHVVFMGSLPEPYQRQRTRKRPFKTWFEPIVPLKYEDKALTIGVPQPILL